MMLVLYAVFYRGQGHVGWYWLGALALTIGIILDALDGYWARNMSKPTSEGQFLDQFVDKWGFVYPLLAALSYVEFGQLWAGWIPIVLVMLLLDIRSCWKHYINYRRSVELKQYNPKAGAVNFGKWKFVTQNVVICVMVASLCPVMDEASHPLIASCSNAIAWLGRTLFAGSYVGLALAIVLAILSLHKRGNGWPGLRKRVRDLSYWSV